MGASGPKTPKAEIIALRAGNELDHETKRPAPGGYRFVTLHARHPATGETPCSIDWAGIRLVDRGGRQYRPIRASEFSSSSSEARPFGLGQRRNVAPHDMW